MYHNRKWKRCKKCFDITLSKQRQISKSENLGLRRRNSPKSISLIKKEKNDFQVTNNFDSNETFAVKNDSQATEKNESSEQIELQNPTNKEENSELSESYSESTNTCYEENMCEEMQVK